MQRIAPGGLDQLRRLAAEPLLGGPEDDEQQDGSDRRRAQRHEDDLEPDGVQLREDRTGVAPQRELSQDRAAAVVDRKALAQEHRRGQVVHERAGLGERDDGGVGGPVDRGRRYGRQRSGAVRGDEGAVGAAELGVEDPARAAEGREDRLELGLSRGVAERRSR